MSRTDLCDSAENPVRLTGQAAGLGITWIGTLLDISERLALRRAERFTIVPSSDEDVTRLIAVIERQRRELDRIRAAAADQSLIAMARGALMERLGLSSAEAASQLANLSAATGMSLGEMAAAVLAQDEPGLAAAREGSRGAGRPSGSVGASGPSSLRAEAAAELAADGAELVGALAAQVLAPLGAAAVVLWLLEADGTLALLGETGLSSGEASRWRRVPPQPDFPAQQVARGDPDLWWPAGRPDQGPVIGPPGGACAVLALRERNGELLGVMSVIWPGPLAEFSTDVRQHLSAVAAGCARVLGSRLARGDLAATQPKAVLCSLLDDLAESVLVLRAIRDTDGQVTDFSVEHVSPGYQDPEGRTGADLTGLTLLEAYPASVSGQGLFARGVQVLADGTPQHVPGPLGDLRLARFYDGVAVTWHHEGSASP